MADIQKKLEVNPPACRRNENGFYCDIEVVYSENWERKDIDGIKISATPGGHFQHDTYQGRTGVSGNPAQGFTRRSGRNGQPVALFTFIPRAEDQNIIITATAGGLTASTNLRLPRLPKKEAELLSPYQNEPVERREK